MIGIIYYFCSLKLIKMDLKVNKYIIKIVKIRVMFKVFDDFKIVIGKINKCFREN